MSEPTSNPFIDHRYFTDPAHVEHCYARLRSAQIEGLTHETAQAIEEAFRPTNGQACSHFCTPITHEDSDSGKLQRGVELLFASLYRAWHKPETLPDFEEVVRLQLALDDDRDFDQYSIASLYLSSYAQNIDSYLKTQEETLSAQPSTKADSTPLSSSGDTLHAKRKLHAAVNEAAIKLEYKTEKYNWKQNNYRIYSDFEQVQIIPQALSIGHITEDEALSVSSHLLEASEPWNLLSVIRNLKQGTAPQSKLNIWAQIEENISISCHRDTPKREKDSAIAGIGYYGCLATKLGFMSEDEYDRLCKYYPSPRQMQIMAHARDLAERGEHLSLPRE
jgi:hypothetical protein